MDPRATWFLKVLKTVPMFGALGHQEKNFWRQKHWKIKKLVMLFNSIPYIVCRKYLCNHLLCTLLYCHPINLILASILNCNHHNPPPLHWMRNEPPTLEYYRLNAHVHFINKFIFVKQSIKNDSSKFHMTNFTPAMSKQCYWYKSHRR